MAAFTSSTRHDSSRPDRADQLRRVIAQVENTGLILRRAAEIVPEVVAVAEAPHGSRRGRAAYRQATFAELETWSRQIAVGMQALGAPPGARLALMVRPGIDFVALVFGLMKAGYVSILIDPGMGKKNLIRCLAEADPDGIIGIARAHALRILLPNMFPKARYNVGVGCRWPGLASLQSFRAIDAANWQEPHVGREDPASIIFTTGSTGVPKGVLYRHRHFIYQALEISRFFEFAPGSVDVSGFPLFALFNAATGSTTVFPRMDFTRPAQVSPQRFIAAIEDWSATQSFGSPALWNTVSRYCERRGIRLESLRSVLSAGAPVPTHVLARCKKVFAEQAEIYTPYGATEALPVACISAREVLEETAAQSANGRGTCVGRAFPEIQWRVIQISDDALPDIRHTEELAPGEIGELMVRGPVVTDTYLTQRWANSLHKIADGSGFWHRMGDVGYLDAQNRFWFCGRKSHRVQTRQGTMYTIPCEAIFNQHPAIYRSALVGVGPPGSQMPVLIAEPWPEQWPRGRAAHQRLIAELRQRAQAHPRTQAIEHICLRKALPVDIRHNAKIFREQLAVWAARRYRDTREVDPIVS